MRSVLRFLRDRLDERSTWRAIVALLTVAGISLDPEQTQAIIAAGVAVGALLEAFLPEPAGRMRDNPIERLREPEQVPSASSSKKHASTRRKPASNQRPLDHYLGNFYDGE